MEYTKYEKARLIGARALQLELGAPPLIRVDTPDIGALEIARLELEHDVLPITVKENE